VAPPPCKRAIEWAAASSVERASGDGSIRMAYRHSPGGLIRTARKPRKISCVQPLRLACWQCRRMAPSQIQRWRGNHRFLQHLSAAWPRAVEEDKKNVIVAALLLR
jgi:hypothetical protein